MYDVAVIGGGPAGTSAAITAASYGARVLLLERGSFPRNKVCGEFVSAESLALLGSLLAADSNLLARAPRIRQARVFIDDRVLKTAIEPAAASMARFDFDAALWKSAQERGVDARVHRPVLAVDGSGPFTIRTAVEEFGSGCVIDASGRWSNLNRKENRHNGVKWLGIKAHFKEDSAADSVDLYFFEGGYCGVQPAGGNGEEHRINVCAMIRADVGKTLEDSFQQQIELKKRSQSWEQVTDAVATSPLLFHPPAPVESKILRVGDAVAFVDPFVGDGISLALRSGALAARCLKNFVLGRASLEQAAATYEQAYRRDLSRVFYSSSKIRQLLTFPAPIRAGILSVLAAFPALTRQLMRITR
jgi:flavin-dependent dehydrogenase